MPVRFAALMMALLTSSEVPGWLGCAFTTTGLPAASADAVSPPATENASGKLLAANTTTGPRGTSFFLRSCLGAGVRSGWARSMLASTQEPSRNSSANILICPIVLPLSPITRAAGSPVSSCTLSDQIITQRINFFRDGFKKFCPFAPGIVPDKCKKHPMAISIALSTSSKVPS